MKPTLRNISFRRYLLLFPLLAVAACGKGDDDKSAGGHSGAARADARRAGNSSANPFANSDIHAPPDSV